jgi:hypothetical protein
MGRLVGQAVPRTLLPRLRPNATPLRHRCAPPGLYFKNSHTLSVCVSAWVQCCCCCCCFADVVSFGGVGDEVVLYPQGGGESVGQVAVTPLHSHSGQSLRELRGHVGDVTSVQVRESKYQPSPFPAIRPDSTPIKKIVCPTTHARPACLAHLMYLCCLCLCLRTSVLRCCWMPA